MAVFFVILNYLVILNSFYMTKWQHLDCYIVELLNGF
jgi:hypothetical protein